MSQNIHGLFAKNPIERSMKHVKSQLAITLIVLVRGKGWTEQQVADELGRPVEWVEALMAGDIQELTVDSMLEMLIQLGYVLDADFFPDRLNRPFRLGARREPEVAN